MSASSYEITLVLGGSRSGKTSFAEKLALEQGRSRRGEGDAGLGRVERGKYVYVATCPFGIDEEMDGRIARHREERSPEFTTVENRLDLAGIAHDYAGSTLLLDCLTLWISGYQHQGLSSELILSKLRQDLTESRSKADWVIVSNEVGMGIVPLGRETREFRDISGWANQLVAELASRVYLVIAGIPWLLKSPDEERGRKPPALGTDLLVERPH